MGNFLYHLKNQKLHIFLVLLTAAIYFSVHAYWKTLAIDTLISPGIKNVGEAHGSRGIGQSFFCRHKNLCGIAIKFVTYGKRSKTDYLFALKLGRPGERNISEKAPVAKVKFNGEEIMDSARSLLYPSPIPVTYDVNNVKNAWYLLRFSPIHHSKNELYYFCIASPSPSPGDALGVQGTIYNPYPEGACYIDGFKQNYDLCFATYYQTNLGKYLPN